jgi:hypothetical protein
MAHAGYKKAPWILIACGLLTWPAFIVGLWVYERFGPGVVPISEYVLTSVMFAGFFLCVFAPFIAQLRLTAKFGVMFLTVALYAAVAAVCVFTYAGYLAPNH